MKLPLFITNRYIKAKGNSKFLSLISVITIAGIVLGVTVLIMAISILNGFEKNISQNIIKFNAHINISGFSQKPLPDHYLTEKKLREELQEKYTALSPYIERKVILSKKNRAEGIILQGIDSSAVENSLKRIIIEGNYKLSKNSFGIIIGKKLAEKINVKLGDKIMVFALNNNEPPSLSNMPIIEQFKITGIYESGMAEYDDIHAYCNFKIAENFFEINDEVTGYNINLADISKIDSIKQVLNAQLPYPFHVRTYKELNRQVFTWLELQKQPIPIILGLIIIVAIFNIVGALLMLVIQKTEAIGVLKSMGTSKLQIVQIFVLQGLYLAAIGIALGNIIAFTLSWLQNTYKIIPLPEQIYFLSSVPISINLDTYIIVSLLALLLCFLASLIPSYIASRIRPIAAIKFN
jgi:lipoprotein-releasing system permease protein